jgi:hypothetical protein
MPAMGPRADAITESKYGCVAAVEYTVVSRRPEGRARRGAGAGAGAGAAAGPCTASARIETVHVTLDLTVTIWLPRRCPPKLAAHEDGHRVIYERIFQEHAEAAARAAARKLVGRTLTATADNCQAAVESAIHDANQAFCNDYVAATAGWSSRVSARFDALTSHGKLTDPSIDEAIRRSFEDEPQGGAAPVEAARRGSRSGESAGGADAGEAAPPSSTPGGAPKRGAAPGAPPA